MSDTTARRLSNHFFRLPIELRHHVYSYIVPSRVHVHLGKRGTLCVSTCVNPASRGDRFCFDRRSTGDPSAEVWGRRLNSSWGSHWRCEEVALASGLDPVDVGAHHHDSARALMSTCKQIYQDVAYLMAVHLAIHITDIATLDFLLDPANAAAGTTSASNLFARTFPLTRNLTLAFRLSPKVYQDIAALSSQPELSNGPSPAHMWMRVWRKTAGMASLRTLDITIDHGSKSSWSTLDEQAVLSTLLPLASAPPRLALTIHVPHSPASPAPGPRSEGRPDLIPILSRVERYARQRFFTEKRQDGSVGLVYEEDAQKMMDIPGQDAAEMQRAAEWIMHIWFQGVDLDYLAMTESCDGGMSHVGA
ncbi:hypothetical protein UVI_02061140 [Ustilaginoidea virens]|nr:hypothetical protein UVI_02061140 [Ustilaginoidea virens]